MALEQEFERAVWSALREAQKHGYYPTRSEDKMNRVRAIAYARELIASSEMQSRFQHLKEMNKLDLSVEHLVAKIEVATLFSSEEREATEWRLKQIRNR